MNTLTFRFFSQPQFPSYILWTSMTSGKKVMSGVVRKNAEDLIFLQKLIEENNLRSAIDRIWPIEEIVDDHRYV